MQPQPTFAGPGSGLTREALRRHARRVADAIVRRPWAGVAGGFGAGYLAGKLPLMRILAGAARMALPLAPPVLAVVGAARVWDFLVSSGDPASLPAREEGGALNELLAITLAAKESYDHAAPRFDGEDRRLLDHLRAVHHEAGRLLKEAVQATGVYPLLGGSPWDGLAVHLTKPSAPLSGLPLLAVMRSAEETYVRALEAALEGANLGEANKTLIRRHLLPRAQENVNSLLRHRGEGKEAAAVP